MKLKLDSRDKIVNHQNLNTNELSRQLNTLIEQKSIYKKEIEGLKTENESLINKIN